MEWKLIYSVFRDVLLVVFLIYTWWVNREKVTAKRFLTLEQQVAERLSVQAHQDLEDKRKRECEEHRKRTAQVEQDLRRAESDLKHLPDSRDFSNLNGKLEKIEGAVIGLRRAVDLMNEFLINQGGKK